MLSSLILFLFHIVIAVTFQESTRMGREAKDIICVCDVSVDLKVSVARLHHVSGASEGESYDALYWSKWGLDEGTTRADQGAVLSADLRDWSVQKSIC
jgi:hypothetical protein